jgi:hypothetical protein
MFTRTTQADHCNDDRDASSQSAPPLEGSSHEAYVALQGSDKSAGHPPPVLPNVTNRTRAVAGVFLIVAPIVWAASRGGDVLVNTVAALAGSVIAIRAFWSFHRIRAGLRTAWWDVFLAGFFGAILTILVTEFDGVPSPRPGAPPALAEDIPWSTLLQIIGIAVAFSAGVTQIMMARRHARLRTAAQPGAKVSR